MTESILTSYKLGFVTKAVCDLVFGKWILLGVCYFNDLINWYVSKKSQKILLKSTGAWSGFSAGVMLFSMNWTSGQAAVQGWASWPRVPKVKKPTDCKPKWRCSACWHDAIFHLCHNRCISQHVMPPPSLLPPSQSSFYPPFLDSLFFFSFFFLNPTRHNKLTCPWSEAKDITLCHITLFLWREVRMCL